MYTIVQVETQDGFYTVGNGVERISEVSPGAYEVVIDEVCVETIFNATKCVKVDVEKAKEMVRQTLAKSLFKRGDEETKERVTKELCKKYHISAFIDELHLIKRG